MFPPRSRLALSLALASPSPGPYTAASLIGTSACAFEICGQTDVRSLIGSSLWLEAARRLMGEAPIILTVACSPRACACAIGIRQVQKRGLELEALVARTLTLAAGPGPAAVSVTVSGFSVLLSRHPMLVFLCSQPYVT